jgi:AraC-like DNA-binding protein
MKSNKANQARGEWTPDQWSWRGGGHAMSRRLLVITEEEWLKSAHDAKYCVNTLAKLYGVSVSTLSRQTRAVFGPGAHVWLRGVRMAQAKHWLAEGMKVVWTARELGYSSEATFSREFKKHCGYPPSEHALRASGGRKFRKMTDWDMK